MRTLGIDYGEKRIGIAVSDDNGKVAFPETVFKNEPSLLKNIADIVEVKKVEKIVIGESKNYDGQDNEIMQEIKDFSEALQTLVDCEIDFHTEFMTSMQAEKTHFQLSEKDKKRGKEKAKDIDAQAAAIMLQSYLDQHTVAFGAESEEN